MLIYESFNKLYDELLKSFSILFNKEIIIYNDFIANGIWVELLSILLSNDYKQSFIPRGLPDLFHDHYTATIYFLRKLQDIYILF